MRVILRPYIGAPWSVETACRFHASGGNCGDFANRSAGIPGVKTCPASHGFKDELVLVLPQVGRQLRMRRYPKGKEPRHGAAVTVFSWIVAGYRCEENK